MPTAEPPMNPAPPGTPLDRLAADGSLLPERPRWSLKRKLLTAGIVGLVGFVASVGISRAYYDRKSAAEERLASTPLYQWAYGCGLADQRGDYDISRHETVPRGASFVDERYWFEAKDGSDDNAGYLFTEYEENDYGDRFNPDTREACPGTLDSNGRPKGSCFRAGSAMAKLMESAGQDVYYC